MPDQDDILNCVSLLIKHDRSLSSLSSLIDLFDTDHELLSLLTLINKDIESSFSDLFELCIYTLNLYEGRLKELENRTL